MVYNMIQKLQPARKTTSIIASVLVAGGMVVASSVLDSAPAGAVVDPTVPDDTTPPVEILPPTGPGTIANSGPTKIPEPSTLGALGLLAAAGVFGVGKKQKKK